MDRQSCETWAGRATYISEEAEELLCIVLHGSDIVLVELAKQVLQLPRCSNRHLAAPHTPHKAAVHCRQGALFVRDIQHTPRRSCCVSVIRLLGGVCLS